MSVDIISDPELIELISIDLLFSSEFAHALFILLSPGTI